MACLLAAPLDAQQSRDAAAPMTPAEAGLQFDLAVIRSRDRFGPPQEELAIWQDFARHIEAQDNVPPQLRGETLLGLAIAHFYAKQHEEGLRGAMAAQALLTADGAAPYAAELHAYTAILLIEASRLEDAQDYAERAMESALQSGAADDLALAHNARASLAFARSDLPGALEGFCTARDIGMAPHRPYHAMVVTNAASCAALNFYLETPETLPAVRTARDYAIAHLPPDHPRMGNIYNTGYAILLLHGRYAEAQELVRSHLALERQLHDGDADDVLDPLTMLARTRERLGAIEDAEELFGAAADMAERLDSGSAPALAGVTRSNQARMQARLGRLEEAEETVRRALARLRADTAPDDYHIGSVRVVLADILGQRGDPEAGLREVDMGLALLEAKLPADHGEIRSAQLVRAQLLARIGRHDDAIALARDGAAALADAMFDLAAGEQEQVALETLLQPGFARYLDVAVRGGFSEDAVRAGQLQLLSTLAVTNARIAGARAAQEDGIGGMLDALEQAQDDVAAAQTALEQAQEEGVDTAGPADRLRRARIAYRDIEAALTEAYPDWTRLTRPHLATLSELQGGLDAGEMLVMPLALPDRAVTLLVTAQDFAWGESFVREDALASLTAQLRRGIANPERFDARIAEQLFAHVFPRNLRGMLAGQDKLLFPATGYLARIPPAMLRKTGDEEDAGEGEWLVRSHAVAVVASLSSEAGSGDRSMRAGRSFLGIGAPADTGLSDPALTPPYRSDLAPLPRAAEELQALAEALQAEQQQVITGSAATEANFRAASATGGGVLAFATHGLIGGEVPGLSEPALLLARDPSRDGPQGDGLLTASEIATMRLDADWVILSACNTASGADGSAATYSGLANAFAEAGARSLMLSHWRVRDDAAAMLSVATMRGAASGLDRAQALRQAQLALMEDTSVSGAAHPAIWAPFVIVEN